MYNSEILVDKTEQKQPRYKFLDILKVIAIICVIVYHSSGAYIYTPSNPTVASNIIFFIGGFLSFCVPMFFMVNGALLFNKNFDIKKHVKKIIKLVILIFTWSVILMILQSIILGYDFTFVGFLKDVFGTKVGYNNHLWYLFALALLYIVFPFLKMIFDNHKGYFIFFAILCAFFTFGNSLITSIIMVVNKIFGDGNIMSLLLSNLYNIIKSFFDPTFKVYSYALAIFMFGGILFYLFKQHQNKIKNKKILINILAPIVLIIALILSYVYCKAQNITDNVWDGYNTIYTLIICFTLFIWAFVNENEKQNKVIGLISKNMFGIYILHYFLQNCVSKFLMLFVDFNVVPIRLVCSILTLAISLLATICLSKIKGVKTLFKI